MLTSSRNSDVAEVMEVLDEVARQVLFDVLLHFSTALVVITLYRNEIWQILKHFHKYKQWKTDIWCRTSWLLFIASVPPAIMGIFLKDYFEKVFENISLVAILQLYGVV